MPNQDPIEDFGSQVPLWERWGVDMIEGDLKNGGTQYVGGSVENRQRAAAWCRRVREQQEVERILKRAERERVRWKIVEEIYERTDGRDNIGVYWRDIEEATGITAEDLLPHLSYLEGEKLVEHLRDGVYYITHVGIREIENHHKHPNRITSHLPTMSINNSGDGNISFILGHGNQVTQAITNLTLPPEVAGLITELTALDGGQATSETTDLQKALVAERPRALAIAAAAEAVAEKSESHKKALEVFQSKLAESLASSIGDATAATAGSVGAWMTSNAPIIIEAFRILFGG